MSESLYLPTSGPWLGARSSPLRSSIFLTFFFQDLRKIPTKTPRTICFKLFSRKLFEFPGRSQSKQPPSSKDSLTKTQSSDWDAMLIGMRIVRPRQWAMMILWIKFFSYVILSLVIKYFFQFRFPSSGFEEIISHPFFRAVDWEQLEAKQISPPYKPRLRVSWPLGMIWLSR